MGFYKDLITTLRSQVEDITGLSSQNIIFSHQPDEPVGSYCVITQLDLDKVGMDKVSTLTDVDEQIWVQATYEIMLRFSFIGSDAMELSTDFDLMLGSPVYLENLLRNNISVMRRGKVKYVPEKRDTKWISRYVQEITFAFGVRYEQGIDVIDEIEWIDPLGRTHTIP